MKNKKGDLSLSINAIVILILAITMLGLGLAFMRNIFGKATTEFEDVSGTVKKQMIDQMKESEKIVELSRPQVELKPGEKTQVFIGFKNDGTGTKNFSIVKVDTSFLGKVNSNNQFSINNVTGVATATEQVTAPCGIRKFTAPGTSTVSQKVYLEFKPTRTTVKAGDIVVLPINIIAASDMSEMGTCLFELKIDTDSTTWKSTGLSVDIKI